MKLRRAKIVLVAFVAFLVALVALADSGHGQQFFQLAKKIPAGDKVGHFVLFGILSFLVNLVLGAAEIRLWRIAFLKGSVIVSCIVTAEEFSQLFFRSRSCDLGDLSADILGIWLCGWLARKYLAWRGVKAKGALPLPSTGRGPG
jgi:VanZ family protein